MKGYIILFRELYYYIHFLREFDFMNIIFTSNSHGILSFLFVMAIISIIIVAYKYYKYRKK